MMMSSVAKVKLLKPRSFLGIIPKASQSKFHQNSDHEIKSYSGSNPSIKMRKNEKVGKKFGLNNGITRGLQNGAASEISNRGKKITNRSWDFKSGAKRFQIRAKITNWGKRDFKIGARISNRCRTFLKRIF